MSKLLIKGADKTRQDMMNTYLCLIEERDWSEEREVLRDTLTIQEFESVWEVACSRQGKKHVKTSCSTSS